ncbi:hypothetical protein FOA52_011159 [Chlamydomonas sp. UWO 241]|nr:hypothetical protein FOA52_011159 [Chlamydomonas sp. UWO 241]
MAVLVAYDAAMAAEYADVTCPPHRLYVLSPHVPSALSPLPAAHHQLLTPFTLSLDSEQLSLRLAASLLAVLDTDVAAVLRELRTQMWEVRTAKDDAELEVVTMLSQTRSGVWESGSLLDAVQTRVLRQKELAGKVPALRAQTTALEGVAGRYADAVAAGSTCRDVLSYMACSDPHCALPDAVFISMFKAAFRQAHAQLRSTAVASGASSDGGGSVNGGDASGVAAALSAPPAPGIGAATLRGLSRLLSSVLGGTSGATFRTLVALHVARTSGDVRADELAFALAVLRNGPGDDGAPRAEPGSAAAANDASARAWAASVCGRLAWLERKFPRGGGGRARAFCGVARAVAADPAAWRAALASSDDCGFFEPGAVADAAAHAAAHPKLAGQPADTEDDDDDGDCAAAPPPEGGVVGWRRERLTRPLHWLLLVAAAAPPRLAAASHALLCAPLLGTPEEPTPGERLAAACLASPPSAPLLLAGLGCGDALDAVRQAQACFMAQCLPASVAGLAEGGEDGDGQPEVQVVVRQLELAPDGPEGCWSGTRLSRLKDDLAAAVSGCHWLLLLNAHVAPGLLLELQHLLSSMDYLVRGDGDSGFRLILSAPHAAVPCLPVPLRAQALQLVLEPPRCAATFTRASMQLLAHPLLSYLGFYDKATQSDIQVASLGICLTTSVLSASLSADPLGATPRAPPYGFWDLMHAVQLCRLLVGNSASGGSAHQRDGDTDGDGSGMDYARLQQLLLSDVFLAAVPAKAAQSPQIFGIVRQLVCPGILGPSYPVHRTLERDAEGEAGMLTWPFKVTPRVVMDFLRQVVPTPPTLEALTAHPTSGAGSARAAADGLQLSRSLGRLTWPPPPGTLLASAGTSLLPAPPLQLVLHTYIDTHAGHAGTATAAAAGGEGEGAQQQQQQQQWVVEPRLLRRPDSADGGLRVSRPWLPSDALLLLLALRSASADGTGNDAKRDATLLDGAQPPSDGSSGAVATVLAPLLVQQRMRARLRRTGAARADLLHACGELRAEALDAVASARASERALTLRVASEAGRPKTLNSSLGVLCAEMWAGEARVCARAAAAHACAMGAAAAALRCGVPDAAVEPALAAALARVAAGCAPATLTPCAVPAACASAATTGAPPPVLPLSDARSALRARVATLAAAAAAAAHGGLARTSPGGGGGGLPPQGGGGALVLHTLSCPGAPLAVYVRAFAQEEVRSLPGVGVRIALMHHAAAPPSGSQAQQQQQQALPARAGFVATALSLFDGVLEREDGSLQEAAPGLPLHACPLLLVTPVFTELQTTKRAATAGPGGSRGAAGIRGQLRKSILSAGASGGGASGGGAPSPTTQRLLTLAHGGESSSPPGEQQHPGSPMLAARMPTTPSLPPTPSSFAPQHGGPPSPSQQLSASIHGASLTLSASLFMAAPSGEGGAVTRPHAPAPTAHVALSLDAVGHACPCLSDGSSFPVQLETKDGLEMLPHAATPRLLLAAPAPGGLADLCGAVGLRTVQQ